MRLPSTSKFGLLAAAAALWGGGGTAARAAYVVASANPNAAVVETFDVFEGTAASVPANVTLGGGTTNYSGVFTGGTSAYTTANGIYAGTQAANPTDRSITGRIPVGSSLTATFGVTNNTGGTLAGLLIRFDVEQYQDATATPNTITLATDNGTNGAAFGQTGLSGDLSTQELQATATTTVYETPLSVSRAVTYDAPVLNGQTVQFQFAWNPGGGGNRPVFGIDNLRVSAVPEPTAVALAGLAGVGLLARRRRRTRA